VPVLSDDDLRLLLKSCDGRTFEDRRDTAIIRLLIDSGMRLSEISALKESDIDFELGVALVLGKGGRPRSAPFGKRTTLPLDRYLRVRAPRLRRFAGPLARAKGRPPSRQHRPHSHRPRGGRRHQRSAPACLQTHFRSQLAQSRRRR
jgi:integrase